LKQLTVRGFDEELARRIRDLSERERISLSQAVLRLLRKATGLDEGRGRADVVGSSLDHLIGTWDEEDERVMAEAIEDLEMIDEDLWR
jgi:hypothetical protein